MVASGDMVYVVWADYRDEVYYPDIYFAKSTDCGTSFGNSVIVNDVLPDQRGTGSPTICVDDEGVIYVVWHDNRTGPMFSDFRIYTSKSIDGGSTFLSDVPVCEESSQANFFASIVVDSQGRVVVGFYDGLNPFYHIYCAVSLDGGLTFQDPVIVDDAQSGNPNAQSIGVGPNDEIYVTWHDERNGNYDIFFDKSTDGGTSFGTDVRVDDTGLSSITQFTPSIAGAEDGSIYIAWRDHRNDTGNNNMDIYGCASTDGGVSFLENVKINDASSGTSVQFRPSIATSGNGLVGVAWPEFPDIYFSYSSDGFLTFSADIKVNDNLIQSDQQQACLAMSEDGRAYVAWSDNRIDPQYDIYFSVGTLPGYAYLPGDASMNNYAWPPVIDIGDILYLVANLEGDYELSPPCNLEGFYASADATGNCIIDIGDILRIVDDLGGGMEITWCGDDLEDPMSYPPALLEGLPDEPEGWPNCDPLVINSNVIPTGLDK